MMNGFLIARSRPMLPFVGCFHGFPEREKMMSRILGAFVCACVVSVGVSAQSYPQGQGGAPTPSTQAPPTQAPATPPTSPTSPQSPNAARANADKKVTISGCIERQPASTAAITGAPSMPFMLTNASAAGAGSAVATSGAAGGASAAKSYRLDGMDTTLTPHVGHKVEITGTIEEQRPASAAAGEARSAPSSTPAATLKVDSVKMVSTTCP